MSRRHSGWLVALFLAIGAIPAVPAAASAPGVTLSATSLDFGGVAWLQKTTRTITVTNTGDAPLTALFADVGQQYVPIDFAVFHQPCSTPIPPGGQCQIPVDFQPQAGGPRSDTLSLYDNALDSPQKVGLSGTGTGAVVRFTPDSLQFVDVPVGTTSAPQSFSAVNAGDAPVTISSVALSPVNGSSKWFAITSDRCSGQTLGPGQRCTVSATATPDAVASGVQGVSFTDNAGTGQQVYDFDKSVTGLQATGGGPLLDASEPVPAFVQDVGTTSAPTRVTVRDSGTQPLQIAGVALDTPSIGLSITADTCSGATLVPNTLFSPQSSCYVDVVFAPATGGSLNANLVFRDNEFGGSHSVLLRTAALAPAAELSTGAIDFGFQQVGVASAPQTVTLTNPSDQPLNVTGVSFSGGSSSIFNLATDTCTGRTVPSAGTCSVSVAFTAPFLYLFSTTMSFADNAPRLPQTVSLRGEGQSPTFTVSTNSLHFGSMRARTASVPQAIAVTNTSSGPLSFNFLSTSLAMVPSGCAGQVAVGSSCTISVAVTPSANGPDAGVLKVVDQAGNQQVVEADWYGISGFANIVPTVGGSGLILQRVGDTISGYAIVYDSGQDSLKVGQVDLPPNPAVAITADGCSNQTIPVGGRCVISVTVHPTSAGSWTATLSIPTDAALGPNPSSLAFSGLATPPPTPVFAPASVSFPPTSAGSTVTQVVWLDNGTASQLGSLPLAVSSVAIGGPNAASFRVAWDGCSGLTLLAAYSCPVAVAFSPTNRGTLLASLLFGDDGAGSPQAVALSGVGLAPAASLTPQTVDFGNVVIRSKSAPVTITLTSSGDLPLSIAGLSISGPNKGNFTIVSETCKNRSLAPGSSCQVVIVFRPDALGSLSAVLAFSDNAPGSPQTIPMVGNGVGK